MISGIYCILNKRDGKVYVGSSFDVEHRWCAHLHKLRSGKHENRYLQNAWWKHGESSFEFVLLDEVPTHDLIKEEQIWLDRWHTFDRLIGYNICPKADSHLGMKMSDEVRQQMSEFRRGAGAVWFGKHLPEDFKQKLHDHNVGENNPRAQLSWDKVKEMRRLWANGTTCIQLAEQFGVTKSCVNNVVSGSAWKDPTYVPVKKRICMVANDVRIQIRLAVREGRSQQEVADQFGLSQQSVSNIVREDNGG